MPNFPTLEPVIVDGGSFMIERLLDRQGSVEVGVGDTLTADQGVALSENLDQAVTLYVSNELGVEKDGLQKYLAKSIGSEVKAGEVVARTRLSQPNTSMHLKCLGECGLVTWERDGRFMRYQIAGKHVLKLLDESAELLVQIGPLIQACPRYRKAARDTTQSRRARGCR